MAHPTQIGRHRVEAVVGEGGMGVVYRAFDDDLERPVAIKVLPEGRAADADARARMLREARAASALRHPGIVTIHEIGDVDGRTFIVMELVEGQTFAELVEKRGRLPPAEAVELISAVGDAIEAAHRAGILHRDLKSANLMVDTSGRVKVLDFGLSKRLGGATPLPSRRTPVPGSLVLPEIDPVAATLPPEAPLAVATGSEEPVSVPPTSPVSSSGEPVTAHGARMGTPGYAAPELLAGEDADARSDVFSLAVVLYELVTGKRPFGGGRLSDISARIEAAQYAPASQASGGAVGPAFDAAIRKALRPRREDRFASIADLVAAVRAAVPGAGGRAHPSLLPVAAVVAFALLLAIAAFALPYLSRRRAPAAATGAPAAADAGGTESPRADMDNRRRLTGLGGCTYSPAFADDRTLVFDLTRGDAVDLWKVDTGGGAPVQLTSAPTWEWRPSPGRRPGEVLFVVADVSPEQRPLARVAFWDLAAGKETDAIPVVAGAAVIAGGELYYVDVSLGALRRRAGGSDRVALAAPDDTPLYSLSSAAGGRRIAVLSAQPDTATRICVIDLVGPKLDCLKTRRPLTGRPAITADGRTLYYGTVAGIARQAATGGPEELIAGASADGGVAVSPDGSLLVYSDCTARGPIVDVSADPPKVVVQPANLADPIVGPAGALAWVRHEGGEAVLVVSRGGVARELTLARLGRVSSPAFDLRGDRLAFVVRDGTPGIYLADGEAINQLTDDPTDAHPVFISGDRVAFTRTDARGLPRVWMAPTGGGQPTAARALSRITFGFHAGRGELLLATADLSRLTWWNPTTGRERPGPAGFTEKPAIEWRLSPSGNWLALAGGRLGHRVWRVALDAQGAPRGKPELAYEPLRGQTLNGIAIGDDGHVLVGVSTWSGDLWAVPAGKGRRFD